MNIVQMAQIRKYNYINAEYITIDSMIKFIFEHKRVKLISILRNEEYIRGYTDLSIIFCINEKDCKRVLQLLKDYFVEYHIEHKISFNNLSIELG
jgi:hypothetical protein